jgi:RHS repeat-associated protein
VTQTDKLFTGQQQEPGDAALGLYNYKARFYSTTLGRFVSANVLTDDGLNRYAYVRNNPATFNDPTGRKTDTQLDYETAVYNENRATASGCDTACQWTAAADAYRAAEWRAAAAAYQLAADFNACAANPSACQALSAGSSSYSGPEPTSLPTFPGSAGPPTVWFFGDGVQYNATIFPGLGNSSELGVIGDSLTGPHPYVQPIQGPASWGTSGVGITGLGYFGRGKGGVDSFEGKAFQFQICGSGLTACFGFGLGRSAWYVDGGPALTAPLIVTP